MYFNRVLTIGLVLVVAMVRAIAGKIIVLSNDSNVTFEIANR